MNARAQPNRGRRGEVVAVRGRVDLAQPEHDRGRCRRRDPARATRCMPDVSASARPRVRPNSAAGQAGGGGALRTTRAVGASVTTRSTSPSVISAWSGRLRARLGQGVGDGEPAAADLGVGTEPVEVVQRREVDGGRHARRREDRSAPGRGRPRAGNSTTKRWSEPSTARCSGTPRTPAIAGELLAVLDHQAPATLLAVLEPSRAASGQARRAGRAGSPWPRARAARSVVRFVGTEPGPGVTREPVEAQRRRPAATSARSVTIAPPSPAVMLPVGAKGEARGDAPVAPDRAPVVDAPSACAASSTTGTSARGTARGPRAPRERQRSARAPTASSPSASAASSASGARFSESASTSSSTGVRPGVQARRSSSRRRSTSGCRRVHHAAGPGSGARTRSPPCPTTPRPRSAHRGVGEVLLEAAALDSGGEPAGAQHSETAWTSSSMIDGKAKLQRLRRRLGVAHVLEGALEVLDFAVER